MVLAAQHAVEGAQGEQGAFGVGLAGQRVGELGQAAGAAGAVVLGGAERVVHEVGGLEAEAFGARFGGGGGEGDAEGGFAHLLVVGERLGQAEGGVGAQGVVEAGEFEGGAQVADGVGG